MSGPHTHGRLVASGHILRDDLGHGAIADTAEHARRLSACWNVFVGIPTEDIEALGGVTLFKGKPMGELAELRAALATAEKMIAERDAMIERQEKSYLVLANCLEDVSVGNQAAWIEWKHGDGAEAAMARIENGLCGPGLIPDVDAPYGTQAQAWFDANRSNPFPKCFCGMPSNIGWMGHGFCSDGHYQQVRAQSVIPGMPAPRELHALTANTARLALHMAAVDLVRQAELHSQVLTITQRPRLPLAMGNYDTVAEIRAVMVRP